MVFRNGTKAKIYNYSPNTNKYQNSLINEKRYYVLVDGPKEWINYKQETVISHRRQKLQSSLR